MVELSLGQRPVARGAQYDEVLSTNVDNYREQTHTMLSGYYNNIPGVVGYNTRGIAGRDILSLQWVSCSTKRCIVYSHNTSVV